jgi:hypothetical protein
MEPVANGLKKKLVNTWYYHKTKIIIVLVIIAVITIANLVFKSNKAEPDVTVMLWGPYKVTDEELTNFNKDFADSIKDVNNDGKKFIELSPTVLNSSMEAYLTLAGGGAQVVILSYNDFKMYAPKDMFCSLDDYVKKSSFDVSLHPEVKMATVSDKTEHVYGIPLEGNKALKSLGLDLKGLYVAIEGSDDGKDGKMIENGYAILEKILSSK